MSLPEELRAAIVELDPPPAPRGVMARVVLERGRGVRAAIPGGEPAAPARRVRPSVLAAAVVVLAVGTVVLQRWPPHGEIMQSARGAGECDMTREHPGFLTASALVLAVACAQDVAAPPPFVSGQSLRAGTVRPGEWTYEVARWEDGILRRVLKRESIELQRAQPGGRAAWRSVGETSFAVPSGVQAYDTLWLDHGLRPTRQTWHYQRGARGATVLELHYGVDSVSGVFQDFGGRAELRREVRVRLPAAPAVVLPSYSLAGLVHVLRALPLSSGWSGSLQTVVNAPTPAGVAVPLSVVGEETISVPAGTFECWRLQVVGRPDARIWVSKAQQLLVMTRDGMKGFELETALASYAPGAN